MDESTFLEVKERLEELGAVDHTGLNFKILNQIRPPWWACLRCVWEGRGGRRAT